MKRRAELFLKEWANSDRRKPLIIRGARQVGKSTLVRNFCNITNHQLIEINFEKIMLSEIEKQKNYSIGAILQEIEVIANQKITQNSIIFLDEIQESPLAIAKLRYFYEERPDIKIIAAGSLLEFALEEHNFSMPVGRIQFLHLGPMTFTEYLWARNQDHLVEYLEVNFPEYSSNTIHEKIVIYYKEFLFIGGMPEAIKTFINSKSFLDVNAVHQEIVETYINDFPKYRKQRELTYVDELFKYAPLHLGEKLIYSKVVAGKSQQIKNSMNALLRAKILTKFTANNCSGLPLQKGQKTELFKLFFLDVGLAGYIQGIKWTDINNPQETCLTKGAIAEQFVAQHLLALETNNISPNLYYWMSEKKNAMAEIDFIINLSTNIIPIEVKAGKTGTLKSLQVYNQRKNPTLSIRMDLKFREAMQGKNKLVLKNKINQLVNLPIYAIEHIFKLNISDYLSKN